MAIHMPQGQLSRLEACMLAAQTMKESYVRKNVNTSGSYNQGFGSHMAHLGRVAGSYRLSR